MSIEDRLFALAQQYAGQYGPAGLADQATLISQLSSQAPDLHAEVRALAAAMSVNAAARIKAAGNADLEAQAIAAEIAASQKLSMAVVTPAVAVARRLDVAAAVETPKPADAGWAGDSVVVGAAPVPAPPTAPPIAPPAAPIAAGNAGAVPPPAPPTADKPIWQNKWAIGGAGAIALLLAYQNFSKPTGQPAPGPAPTSSNDPFSPNPNPTLPNPNPVPTMPNPAPTGLNPPGPNNQGLPELAPPGGPLPTLLVRQQGQGFVVGFSLRGAAGLVAAPQGGWDRGPGMIAFARDPRAQKPDSVGGGTFERISSNQGPSRLMRVQWQQDGLNVGAMCVAFVGSGGQDVNPAGSRLCVLDGGCSQAVACGQLPSGGQPSGGGQPGGDMQGGGGMQPGQ